MNTVAANQSIQESPARKAMTKTLKSLFETETERNSMWDKVVGSKGIGEDRHKLDLLLSFLDVGYIKMNVFLDLMRNDKIGPGLRDIFIREYSMSYQKNNFNDFIKDTLDAGMPHLAGEFIKHRWSEYTKAERQALVRERFMYPDILLTVSKMLELEEKFPARPR